MIPGPLCAFSSEAESFITGLRIFLSRLTALFRQSAEEQQLDEELQEHLALLTDRYLLRGMDEKQARAAAQRQFGKQTQLRENLREQRTVLFFENALQDIRYAVRQLLKSPAFSLTAILTLALSGWLPERLIGPTGTVI